MTGLDQTDMFQSQSSDAVVCGRYRYMLERIWSDVGGILLWIMLNPSKADAKVNDPTAIRVIGFSKLFGFGGCRIVNMFGFRSSSPANLLTAADPVGPKNDEYISKYVIEADTAICAWGALHPKLQWRVRDVRDILDGPRLMCLGTTKNGSPRHPLYIPATAQMQPYGVVS